MGRRASMKGDLLKGAIAGATATWAMDRATRFFRERQDRRSRRREQRARGGATPEERAAEGLASTGALPARHQGVAATALHWSVGIGAGAAYGVVRKRIRPIGRTRGVGFGSSFFLFVDEAVVPMLGLSPAPGDLPWQAHVRGLSGHIVFGTVADVVFSSLDRIA